MAPSATRFYAIAGLILAVALLMRVGVVFALRPFSEEYQQRYLVHDALVYHRLGVEFMKTNGNSDYFRETITVFAPGYAILLGSIYKVFGVNVTVAVLVNVVFSVFTCWLLMLLVRRVSHDIAGWVAGFLFAFHPHSIRFACLLYSETIFMFLNVLFLLVLSSTFQPRAQRATTFAFGLVLAGLIGSAGTFMRISMLYFAPLATLIWLTLTGSRWRRVLLHWMLFLLAYGVWLSPWMAYNKVHYDTYRISVSGEHNLVALVVGSAFSKDIDEFHRVKNQLVAEAVERATRAGAKNYFEVSPYLLEVAFEKIRQEPWRFALSLVKGFFNFWFRPVQAESSRVEVLKQSDQKVVYYIAYSYVFQLILFLAWLSSLWQRRDIPSVWRTLSLVAVLYFAATVGNAAYSRFFLQAVPYIIPLAAINISRWHPMSANLIKRQESVS